MPNPPTPAAAPDDRFFRHLCENLGVALIGVDRDLKVRSWNGAAAVLFGAGAEQMMGVPVLTAIPYDRREAAQTVFTDAVQSRKAGELEFSHRDERGGARELIITVSAVADEQGRVLGASACVRDITRRINLQKQVDRTGKMLALGAMAGAVAHHFNNILGGVVTTVDFALGSDDPVAQRKALELTAKGIPRATALLARLLEFAEGGVPDTDLGDLTETVIDVVQQFEGDLAEGGIELKVALHKVPVMPIPRGQITTVLVNLIRNAMEAMPGGGTLRVTVGHEGDFVLVRVADTGCGLDEQAIERIFEPFYSTKEQPDVGTTRYAGLGLPVAHGIVQMLGGDISVTSTPGKGSEFVVRIPRPQPAG